MSLGHGAKTVTDGLVFAYDMENTKKSWKGKPTTNLYIDGNYENSYLHPVRNGPWSQPEGIRDPNGNKVVRVDADGTTSYNGRDITVTVGQTYSSSCWIYVSSDADTTLVQLRGEQGYSSNGVYDISKKGTWQYVTSTGIASTTNARILPYQISNMTTGYCLFGSVQFEQNVFATPFIEGTRSNTEAILDMVGGNTITATSLTYNSDGSFSFDGSSNYIQIPSGFDFSEEQTIEIWLQPLENDGSRRNPYNQAYGGYGTWTHEPSGYINYFYGNAGGDAQPYSSRGSAIVQENEIACMCVTRNINTITWYKNGEITSTASNVYGVLVPTLGNITIGSGYAGKYLGNIFSTKLYDRALTEQEVKQNFSALRSRFQI